MTDKEQASIERTLGRMEGSLDALHSKLDSQHDRLNNHGGRIASLERWRWYILGGATAIGIAWKVLNA